MQNPLLLLQVLNPSHRGYPATGSPGTKHPSQWPWELPTTTLLGRPGTSSTRLTTPGGEEGGDYQLPGAHSAFFLRI